MHADSGGAMSDYYVEIRHGTVDGEVTVVDSSIGKLGASTQRRCVRRDTYGAGRATVAVIAEPWEPDEREQEIDDLCHWFRQTLEGML